MEHHNTIRKYTAALLDLFNGIEVSYKNSLGDTITKTIPIVYSVREKNRILDGKTAEQLRSGNFNVLPRANLALSTMNKVEQRITNKNTKISIVSTPDTFEFMYNSIPFEFTYELSIACRGMNETTQIIEQIAPMFNPIINIDIWDAQNLHEPTRVPVKLLDIGIENEEYEELSSNIINLNIGISIVGNIYPPIKTIDRIREFKIYLNEKSNDFYSRKSILGWDVNDSGKVYDGKIYNVENPKLYPPTINGIFPNIINIGENNLSVIYEDIDNKDDELTFKWDIISGTGTIVGNTENAVLTTIDTDEVIIMITITDIFGNHTSFSKIFNFVL